MKIPLLIIITLIFFILITGCITEPPSKGNLTAHRKRTRSQYPRPRYFRRSSKFTSLMTVTGQTGKTSDTFLVPGGYWELWYTADPLITGGQDSVSASGSNSALFPHLSIQVIDKTNSARVVETVEPQGGLDKTLWAKSGIDPRPGNRNFTREIKSTIL